MKVIPTNPTIHTTLPVEAELSCMCSKALHCTSLPLCFYFGSEPAHHCLACKDQQSSKKPHFAFYGLIWTVRLVKCRKMGFSTATSLFQRSVAHQKQNNFLIIALNRRFISNTHIRIYSVEGVTQVISLSENAECCNLQRREEAEI